MNRWTKPGQGCFDRPNVNPVDIKQVIKALRSKKAIVSPVGERWDYQLESPRTNMIRQPVCWQHNITALRLQCSQKGHLNVNRIKAAHGPAACVHAVTCAFGPQTPAGSSFARQLFYVSVWWKRSPLLRVGLVNKTSWDKDGDETVLHLICLPSRSICRTSFCKANVKFP